MRHGNQRMVIGAAVPSLVRWGCSPDADLVYRALVTLGPRTARGLKEDLDLAVGRVERALDELVAIEAVVSRPSARRARGLWAARPSTDVVARLHRGRRRAEPSLDARAAPPAPLTFGDGLRHLSSRALARQRLGELLDLAGQEHMSMQPEASFEAESVRAAQPLDRALLRRGVRMRALGVLPRDADPIVSVRRTDGERRPDYRQAAALPMKLIVVDQKIALFPVDPHHLEKGYLEVAQAPIVSALCALFERHWSRAWDPREEAMEELTLSARERALVVLLAAGHTDVTAAQELGISARSVSSILRHLMDRLEVANRFQLGVALGALRVVPPPRGRKDDEKGNHG
ncbi:LuxR C-terminal-related transcriptional regulator [Actinomycetes bacterium KLBMP 9797]